MKVFVLQNCFLPALVYFIKQNAFYTFFIKANTLLTLSFFHTKNPQSLTLWVLNFFLCMLCIFSSLFVNNLWYELVPASTSIWVRKKTDKGPYVNLFYVFKCLVLNFYKKASNFIFIGCLMGYLSECLTLWNTQSMYFRIFQQNEMEEIFKMDIRWTTIIDFQTLDLFFSFHSKIFTVKGETFPSISKTHKQMKMETN